MMASELAGFWVHTVQVETRTGTGSTGPLYAAAVPVPECFVEAGTRLVLDSNGRQVASSETVYADPSTAARFAIGSRVTTDTGRHLVIIAKVHTAGTLGLPEHVEVALQ